MFSSLISDEDNERRDRERKRKEDASQRRHFLQQDQAHDSDEADNDGVKEHIDCETARLEATQQSMKGGGAVFVPECDRAGQYSPVQCYKSEGYCWCVDTVSGRPIPGEISSMCNLDPRF